MGKHLRSLEICPFRGRFAPARGGCGRATELLSLLSDNETMKQANTSHHASDWPQPGSDNKANLWLRPFGKTTLGLIAMTLAAATASGQTETMAQSDEDELERLEAITVEAEDLSAQRYLESTAPTLLKTPSTLAELPISAQVVSARLIEDQALQGLEDVFQNVSGVIESGNTLNAQSEVMPVIRGFEAPLILRNGLRATTVGAVDLVNIESVEVLKGPASITFGALEPGGVLNYTTKKPLNTPFYEIEQEFGSYEHYRTTFDTTGPINASRTLLYRINGAYNNSGSFRDEIDLERFAINPALTWLISDATEVNFEFSYTHETLPYDSGIPLSTTGEPLVADDTFFGDPDLVGRELDDYFATISLQHEFNSNLSARTQFQYHLSTPKNESIRHRGITGSPEVLRQRYQNEDRTDEEFQWVTELMAEFSTGPVDHAATLGLDLIWQENEFDRFRQNLPNAAISNDPNVDFTPPANLTLAPAFDDSVSWIAAYAQDHLSMLEDGRLKVLLGGRFDYVEQESNLAPFNSSEESQFTSRAGVLYELTDWVSPYFSVAQSFRPQTTGTVDQSGNILEPETGFQFEAGLKISLFEERLLATASLYQIEKENVSAFDNAFFIATGNIAFLPGISQRSEGFELDISGEVSDNFSILANYAYTDAEDITNSVRLGNVAYNTFRLWGAYDFDSGALDGFGIGAGVRYVGERTAQFDTTPLDAYATFDAGVWYRYELDSEQTLKARLNLKNLFGEDYIRRASTRDIAHPGEPFTATASIGIEF